MFASANGKSSGLRIRRCAPAPSLPLSDSKSRSARYYPLQVNITVNGKHIPFNMKIGGAGEAFFVFETAGDVPDELITSPILEAIRSPEIQGQDAQAGQVGVRDEKEQDVQHVQQSEPDFLDLDASPAHLPSGQMDQASVPPEAEEENEEGAVSPSSLFDRAVALGASIGNAVLEEGLDESLKARERAKVIFRTAQGITHQGAVDPDNISLTQQQLESMPHEPIYNDGVQNPSCVSLSNSNVRQRRCS